MELNYIPSIHIATIMVSLYVKCRKLVKSGCYGLVGVLSFVRCGMSLMDENLQFAVNTMDG